LPDRILHPFGSGVIAALLAVAGATMTRMPQIHAQGVDSNSSAQEPGEASGVLPGAVASGSASRAASGALTPSAGASDAQARNPNPAERNTEAESGNTARADGDAGGSGTSWLLPGVAGGSVLVALRFGAALWQRRRHQGAY
jgi:hypothetical protein